jgi:hypothetical protein
VRAHQVQVAMGVRHAAIYQRSLAKPRARTRASLASDAPRTIGTRKRLPEKSAFFFGDNTFGQLGHFDSSLRGAGGLDGALGHEPLASVACGRAHTLAVTAQGLVFSWGCGEKGAFGAGHVLYEAASVYAPLSVPCARCAGSLWERT